MHVPETAGIPLPKIFALLESQTKGREKDFEAKEKRVAKNRKD